MKKALIFITVLILVISMQAVMCFAIPDTAFKDETKREVTTLYDGVTMTHIELGKNSAYGGKQSFWVVEFDPKQEDLAVNVTGGGKYANQLFTVQKTMENFANDNPDKTPLAGINGDLWMVSYAHARVEGSGTSYGGYSDAVVTKSLTLPRGMDIYNGEIITSPHSEKETPYEGSFQSFGITEDGQTILGTPTLTTKVINVTKSSSAVKITGLNRLPANNALMLYSDKGCEDNYSLDDAYEVIIDCDYDYTIKSGETIKGKVTKIVKSGDKNEKMKENRLILCARGSSSIKKVQDFEIGDELEFSFTINAGKDKEVWQKVTNAVGGHIVLIQNGKIQSNGDPSHYPTSIIGDTADGKIVMITADGRQGSVGYTDGFTISQMPKLVKELGLQNAFVLDGGGSATMVALDGEEYELINTPCDTFSDGKYGCPRTVVNSIIVSAIKKTAEPEVTPEPTNSDNNTDEEKPNNSGCGSMIGTFSVSLLLGTAVLFKKKEERWTGRLVF